tara:strand:- start:6771 stop:6971 length:201 start_codon:yes stop_codon:yes gene_type:complete
MMDRLTNHQSMMLNAIRTGRKDARIDSASDASTYGARPNSSWASWYKWGRDMLPMPAALTRKGVEI